MMIIHCYGIFEKKKRKNLDSINNMIENEYYENSDFSKGRNASKEKFREYLNKNFKESDFRLLEIDNGFGEAIAFDKSKKYYIFHNENDLITNSSYKRLNILIFSDDNNIIESINKTRQDIMKNLKSCIKFEIESNSKCTLYPYDLSQKYKYELDKSLQLDILVKGQKNKVAFWRNVILIIALIPAGILSFTTSDGWQSLFINITWGVCFFFITEVITKYIENKNDKEIVYISDISKIISNYHDNISEEIEQMDKMEKVLPLGRV